MMRKLSHGAGQLACGWVLRQPKLTRPEGDVGDPLFGLFRQRTIMFQQNFEVEAA